MVRYDFTIKVKTMCIKDQWFLEIINENYYFGNM